MRESSFSKPVFFNFVLPAGHTSGVLKADSGVFMQEKTLTQAMRRKVRVGAVGMSNLVTVRMRLCECSKDETDARARGMMYRETGKLRPAGC